eukprot:TRINITY_DN435_c2_g8_i2.p1 TRINITY_DN435_c2_g8~~TRINITY_DN435_c2_g8_i2.p1  ORF type:complete len:1118 (+),score=384.08 TRINITY_DN435_c2_g8_i2:11710-15063(+)
MAEAGVTGAVVVQVDLQPLVTQLLQRDAGLLQVGDETTLGHLDLQQVGGEMMASQGLAHGRDQALVIQLAGRDIDGHRQQRHPLRAPLHQLATHGLDDPAPQRLDQVMRLGQADEFAGKDQAMLGMLPADQRFHADHTVVLQLHLGLVMQAEFVLLERLAEASQQLQAAHRDRIERGIVEAIQAAAGALGVIHGGIGIAHQGLDALAITRIECDADAGRGLDMAPLQVRIRRAQGLDELVGDLGHAFLTADFRHQHHELVTAQARHQVVLAHRRTQAPCHLLQQRIPHGMALGIVDELELVEVEEEQGIQVAAALGARELGGGQLVEQHAVGDAGKVVVRGQLVGAAFLLFELVDQAALLALRIEQLLVQVTPPVRQVDQAGGEQHDQQRHQHGLQVVLPVRRPQPGHQHLRIAAHHHGQRIMRQAPLHPHMLHLVTGTQRMDQPIALACQQEGRVLLARIVGAAGEDAPGQLGQLQAGGIEDLDTAGTGHADFLVGLQEIAQVEDGREEALQLAPPVLQGDQQRHAPAVAVAVVGRIDDHGIVLDRGGRSRQRAHVAGIDETAQLGLALLPCGGIDQAAGGIEHGHAQVGRIAIEEWVEVGRRGLLAIEHGLADARIQQGLAQHFIEVGRDDGSHVAAVGNGGRDGQLLFILDADDREIPGHGQHTDRQQYQSRRDTPAREQSGQQPFRLEQQRLTQSPTRLNMAPAGPALTQSLFYPLRVMRQYVQFMTSVRMRAIALQKCAKENATASRGVFPDSNSELGSISDRSVPGLVNQLVGLDPGHHGAQLLAHDFDLVFGIDTTTRHQGRCTGLVFQDEALGVFAGLDVFQHLLHRRLALGVDHARAGHVLAVFGVVGDRVVHVGDAAFIDQVDDQLQFMQALEVSHFRRVASFHQGFETGLDQVHGPAAQHGLFAEQIGFGFFAEVGFDDAGTAAAIGGGVRQGEVTGRAGLVLVHGDQVRHAATLAVGRTHGVARGLRGDHDDVQVSARHDLAVVDVEAVRESDGRALLGERCNVLGIDLADVFVGQQDHDDVSVLDRVVDFSDLQAGLLGLGPGSAAAAQTDGDLHARILQVQRVSVTLRTVTDDGHVLVLDQGQVCVFVVENFHDFSYVPNNSN